MKVLVFDLEVREQPDIVGWKNYAAQGISFGCAYLYGCEEFRLYGEENITKLMEDMEAADLIVGFNILDFDMPLLRATIERVTGHGVDHEKWMGLLAKCYDILADIRDALGTKFAKGWKLDQVAQSNLQFTKNGDGALAPQLWKDGKFAELATYVIQDVKVEKAMWEHVLTYGEVKNKFTLPSPLKLKQIEAVKGRYLVEQA